MGNNEFIKWAKFLDDNGAFSVADELENDFVKIAQDLKSYERDPYLPAFDQGVGGSLMNFMNYLGGGVMNVFATKRQLMTDRLYETRSFILSPIAQNDRKFALYLWEAINSAVATYGKGIDPKRDNKLMTSDLQKYTNYDDMWNNFGNWVQFCRQILIGQKKTHPFLSALTKAEQYLATLIDPDYKPTALKKEDKQVAKPSVQPKTPTTTAKPAPKTKVQKKPTAPLMVDWSGSGVEVSNTKPATEPTIDFE